MMNIHLINHVRHEIASSLRNIFNSKISLIFSVQVEIEEISRKVNLNYSNMLQFCESNIKICSRDQKNSFLKDEDKVLEKSKSNCESDVILSKNPHEVVENKIRNKVEVSEFENKVGII